MYSSACNVSHYIKFVLVMSVIISNSHLIILILGLGGGGSSQN